MWWDLWALSPPIRQSFFSHSLAVDHPQSQSQSQSQLLDLKLILEKISYGFFFTEYSDAHSLTYSLTHSLAYTITHKLPPWLFTLLLSQYCCVYSLTYSLTRSQLTTQALHTTAAIICIQHKVRSNVIVYMRRINHKIVVSGIWDGLVFLIYLRTGTRIAYLVSK